MRSCMSRPAVELYYSLTLFFSSRRRHTRCDCDWSSGVCSSDLRFVDSPAAVRQSAEFRRTLNPFGQIPVLKDGDLVLADSNALLVYLAKMYGQGTQWLPEDPIEIGRGSGRERGEISVVAVSFKK